MSGFLPGTNIPSESWRAHPASHVAAWLKSQVNSAEKTSSLNTFALVGIGYGKSGTGGAETCPLRVQPLLLLLLPRIEHRHPCLVEIASVACHNRKPW
jgi:hypothetical protein